MQRASSLISIHGLVRPTAGSLVGLLLLLTSGCGSGPTESRVHYEPNLPTQAMNIPGSPFAPADLYHSLVQTVTLIRVEAPLGLHRHMHSEETVYVISGQGVLHTDGVDRPVRAGDLVVVPRNTVHGYTPTGEEPTVVLSIMTPPFQHGDRIFEEGHEPQAALDVE